MDLKSDEPSSPRLDLAADLEPEILRAEPPAEPALPSKLQAAEDAAGKLKDTPLYAGSQLTAAQFSLLLLNLQVRVTVEPPNLFFRRSATVSMRQR